MKAIFVFFALLSLFHCSSLSAQQPVAGQQQHGKRTFQISRATQAVKLDGVLDEKDWATAAVTRDFLQRDPQEGAPASEKTEVRALYDQRNLYFGVNCFDSNPDGILGAELRRDNSFGSDDTFAVIIDTFHDHRNSVLFRVNPRGTQYDALITEEGNDVNPSWDEQWEVETQTDERGWSVEIKIPLKSIRFSTSEERPVFGIDFERVIRRRNEFTYWNNHSRNFNFNQVSQAGHLQGMEGLETGFRVRIKPYVNGRVVTQGREDRNTSLLGDVGLEDLKVPVTSGLTLDATANTDFAQTEVDDQIISFDRFEVFFPEKREFFLEGAGVFEFGVLRAESIGRAEGAPQIKLYHSRRIGLSRDGKAIPILAGAKLTGKLSEKFTLGLLQAQTGDYQGKAGDNFTVLRLKRNILSRSSVGLMLSNRQSEGGDYNRLVGVDENLVVLKHLKIAGTLARSFSDGVRDKEWMGLVGAAWEDDLINAGMDYAVLEKNFASDVGFLARGGVRRYEPRFGIFPRARNSKKIRQFEFSFRMEHIVRLEDNQLDTEQIHLNNFINFQDGGQFRSPPHRVTENLVRPLRLPGGLVVPPGRYRWWYLPVTYVFSPARKFSGSFQYRLEWNYYGKGGKRQLIQIKPVLRPSRRFSAEIDYSINRITLPAQGTVNFHLMNNRFNLALSRKWLTSTLLQYNSAGDLFGVNFRLNYIYRPGDDLFIVLNDFRIRTGPVTNVDRSITVKFTHSFDF